jgi:hypothetical protein
MERNEFNGGLSGTKQQECTEESPAPTLQKHKHTVGIHRCKNNGSHGGVSGDNSEWHAVSIHRCTSQRMNGGFSSTTRAVLPWPLPITRRCLRWKNDPVLQEWV